MKTVMVFGTFDLLHPGHLFFIRESKKRGDFLTAVVARDETVRKVKAKQPHWSEGKRLDTIRALPEVDRAVLGGKGDKYEVIRKYRPDVICLGYDQQAFTHKISELFPEIPVIRIAPYKPETFKTSKLGMSYDRH